MISRKLQTRLIAGFIIIFFFAFGAFLLSQKKSNLINTTLSNEQEITQSSDTSATSNGEKPSIVLDNFKRELVNNGQKDWEITGSKVEIYNEQEKARLTSPRLKIFSEDTVTNLKAKLSHIFFDKDQIKQAIFKEDVLLTKEDFFIKSNQAQYDLAKDRLKIATAFSMQNQSMNISANSLDSNLKDSQHFAKDNVISIFRNSQGEQDSVPTKITSEELTLFEKENRFIYKHQVKLEKETLTLTAAELHGLLNEQQEVIKLTAIGSVKIIDQDMLITADRVIYDFHNLKIELYETPQIKQKGDLITADFIHGIINQQGQVEKLFAEENAKITRNQKKGPKETLSADSIEGELSENEITKLKAQGNVVIDRPQEMHSESALAIYDLIQENITLLGNPELLHQGNRVQADQIIYNLNTKESLAQGNVRIKTLNKK